MNRQQDRIEFLHLSQARCDSGKQLPQIKVGNQRLGYFEQKRFFGLFSLGDVLHYLRASNQPSILAM